MNAEMALTLIEGVLRQYRDSQDADQDEAMYTRPLLAGSVALDNRVVKDGATDYARPSNRSRNTSSAAARMKYSVRAVRDGHTIQLRNPTPGMLKVVDFLKAAPGSDLRAIMEGTGLSKNTVANLFTALRKQKILDSQHA